MEDLRPKALGFALSDCCWPTGIHLVKPRRFAAGGQARARKLDRPVATRTMRCITRNTLIVMPTSAPASHSRPSPTRTINVRVPAAVYQQLETLATATARTKSFVTVEALSSYLEQHSWQVQDIEAGMADADKGDFAPDAEVNAVFAKYGA